MLKQTFIHIPGVGPKTEKKIWRRGIFTWQDFIIRKRYNGFLSNKVERIKKYLLESERALNKKDVLFFAETLPKAEFWRLYPEFKDKMAFLDIETTGLSPYYNQITLVTLFDGRNLRFFMDGINLRELELQRELAKYSIIVTFNGTFFDIPFLKYKFPNIKIPPVHIDLRYALRRLGYTGGLKKIEDELSIKREKDVDGLESYQAAVLWNAFIREFDLDALGLLIRYNIADVLNLQKLFHIAYNKLGQKKGCKKLRSLGTPVTRTDLKPRLSTRGGKIHIYFDSKMHYKVNPRYYKKYCINVDMLLRYFSGTPKVVGIDLKSSEKRNSGYALLEGNYATTQLVKTDKEMVDLILTDQPLLVSIDSPLGLPKGRDCTKESCKKCSKFGIIRECEKTLLSRRVPVYSCLLPSMKPLTERGRRLAKTIRDLGFEVIESYPGAAQDILHITRKKIDVDELKQSLIHFGLTGEFIEKRPNHDELDAITSALVGYFYLSGNYEPLGDEKEELLIVPLNASSVKHR